MPGRVACYTADNATFCLVGLMETFERSGMTVLHAFTMEQAARASGVSERRIAYWDRTGVLSPSLSPAERTRGPHSRIYSFRDLVGLRTLGELRDRYHLPLQTLRVVGHWLRDRYAEPWASLRFFVLGSGRTADILLRDPESDAIVSARKHGQVAIAIELEPIARRTEAEAAKLVQRTSDQFGKVVQNRYVLGNAPVLAGTRVPTAAVWDFHEAGYDTPAILREYPRLTPLDIQRAIAYEQERRHPQAEAS